MIKKILETIELEHKVHQVLKVYKVKEDLTELKVYKVKEDLTELKVYKVKEDLTEQQVLTKYYQQTCIIAKVM
jgi:hypothetical protein